MKKIILTLVLFYTTIVQAQRSDSLGVKLKSTVLKVDFSGQDELVKNSRRIEKLKQLIVPGALITYGIISLRCRPLQKLDNHIKEEIWNDHPHKTIKVDNYLQYAPAFSVYTLNAMGIKGKNNLRDGSMIYLLSNAMMGITVESLKAITKIQRPDGFGTNAFPSGHTATAFAAAEFLRQEYKDISPWYGIAGYAAAATTGYMRMYNNKHWFRDLLPGAGIGIVCTKASYWIYPAVKKKLSKDKPLNTMVIPFYQDRGGGLSLVYNVRH